jgi:cytochrome b pre-mRNA-processing protein 3
MTRTPEPPGRIAHASCIGRIAPQYALAPPPASAAADPGLRRLSILQRVLNRGGGDRAPLRPLYAAIVAEARRRFWYVEGQVPDTLDSRFDMVAAVLALVLLRLEREGQAQARTGALLAEIFVEDMDGQLREMGIGDIIVGKHIGRMMGALGGRLGVYRDALAGTGSLREAIGRNIYRGVEVPEAALAATEGELRAIDARLAAMPAAGVLAAEWRSE